MSERRITPSQPSLSVLEYVKRAHALNWPEYSTEDALATQLPDTDWQEPPTNVLNKHGYYVPMSDTSIEELSAEDLDLKSFDREVAICKNLANDICDGPFRACNARVAEAVQQSIDLAITSLQSAHEAQKGEAVEDTPALLTLQALRANLTATGVMLGVLDYQSEASNTLVNLQNGSYLQRRDGQLSRTCAIELSAINDYADADGYDDFFIPGTFTMSADDHRVNMEVHFAPESLRQQFTSDIEQRGRLFEQNTFSLRIDKDPLSPTGYSLDFGRDSRDEKTYKRTADAAGKSVQAIRPDISAGSHFTDSFKGVSDSDFAEFTDNLKVILQSNIDMFKHDRYLRGKRRLGGHAIVKAA